ncbi:N-acetylated-alpha-linked acidic dipeptidase 2, partial [Durusdinium trenchii]
GLEPPGAPLVDSVRLQSPVRSPCHEGAELPWRHSRSRLDPRSSSSDGPQWHQPSPQPQPKDGDPVHREEAWGDAADSLVANELATIYQLVKAKSERIMDKEKEVHRSECFVAQAVGAAKASLRAEVEGLLQISRQELRKEANVQKRRLEELFQKAQDEFRKAVAWRKEARALKGAATSERDTHEKLQKKVQELVRREKALRQQHAEEKGRWAEEKDSCISTACI